jgi:hypothetical protein
LRFAHQSALLKVKKFKDYSLLESDIVKRIQVFLGCDTALLSVLQGLRYTLVQNENSWTPL